MKNNFIKYAFSILAFTLVFASCNNKEELAGVANKTTATPTDILTFNTKAEFDSTVQKVSLMSPDEKKSWEKSKGFKSFGTTCDEFYQTINPERFKSSNEVNDFIAQNSDKICIYTNDAGDKYCEVKEFDNTSRFIMNSNKMYIVGTTVFKQFEEGLISSDIANVDKLKNAKNYNDLSNDAEITRIFKIGQTRKIANARGPRFREVFKDKGSKRLVVRLRSDFFSENGYTKNWYLIQVSNYNRWAGILWGFTVNTSYNITLNTIDDNKKENLKLSFTKSETNDPLREHTPLDHKLIVWAVGTDTGNRILSYTVTGSNDSGCIINASENFE